MRGYTNLRSKRRRRITGDGGAEKAGGCKTSIGASGASTVDSAGTAGEACESGDPKEMGASDGERKASGEETNMGKQAGGDAYESCSHRNHRRLRSSPQPKNKEKQG